MYYPMISSKSSLNVLKIIRLIQLLTNSFALAYFVCFLIVKIDSCQAFCTCLVALMLYPCIEVSFSHTMAGIEYENQIMLLNASRVSESGYEDAYPTNCTNQTPKKKKSLSIIIFSV